MLKPNFRELIIWKEAMSLTLEIYRITKLFPSEEKFGIGSQLNRCAVSVPSNIAEGSARKTDKDFAQFIAISLGSLFELETQVIISKELNFISEKDFSYMIEKIQKLQKMISGFKKSLTEKSLTS